MFKVTAVSKVLIGPRDQVIKSGSRHFDHDVKVRMVATFLIGPFFGRRVLGLVHAFYPQFLTTSG